ncbi:hypothetical protein [Methylobacter sp. BlB1]|uniref:hypothetical protein n=1 Tax=Methylobacter sp. BlB1 TaxID=2785914 RepID=UPI0018930FDB|nr:hypothetical protein [Methylobacter sp. BlB1]MBF6650804.1 hypothetical protein [Methylobacter sp. BlB1]
MTFPAEAVDKNLKPRAEQALEVDQFFSKYDQQARKRKAESSDTINVLCPFHKGLMQC